MLSLGNESSWEVIVISKNHIETLVTLKLVTQIQQYIHVWKAFDKSFWMVYHFSSFDDVIIFHCFRWKRHGYVILSQMKFVDSCGSWVGQPLWEFSSIELFYFLRQRRKTKNTLCLNIWRHQIKGNDYRYSFVLTYSYSCYASINLTGYHPPGPLNFSVNIPAPGTAFQCKTPAPGSKKRTKIPTPGHNLPSSNAKISMK